MKTTLFKLTENTPFTEPVPVPTPIGENISLTKTALACESKEAKMGIWECTPGTWKRAVKEAEYSYFIKGRGRFIPDNNQPEIEFKKGDGLYFPENTTGTWIIEETVLKSYTIFKLTTNS